MLESHFGDEVNTGSAVRLPVLWLILRNKCTGFRLGTFLCGHFSNEDLKSYQKVIHEDVNVDGECEV